MWLGTRPARAGSYDKSFLDGRLGVGVAKMWLAGLQAHQSCRIGVCGWAVLTQWYSNRLLHALYAKQCFEEDIRAGDHFLFWELMRFEIPSAEGVNEAVPRLLFQHYEGGS